MKPLRTLALSALLAWPAASIHGQTTADTGPLTICLQSNDPPLSARGKDPGGFIPALSRVIADRIGRDLHLQWFVSRDDPDASLAKDANALLSDHHCDLVAEYPLLTSMIDRPLSPAAKLPPFDGAKPDDRRRWVATNPLAATRPYRSDSLIVVLAARDAERPVHRLAELNGLKIGVQIATLADAIAMQYDDGMLAAQVVHLTDSPEVFGKLQAGDIDAAFVDQRALDAWRLQHRASALAPSGYRHSIGFNMGYVGLASSQALIEQVSGVLAGLREQNALAPLAASAGLTFIPPTDPAIQPDIRPLALQGD